MKPPMTPNTKSSVYTLYMFNESLEVRKKEASKVKQTIRQSNTAPRVGLKPTTLYTLDRALNQLSCLKSYIS